MVLEPQFAQHRQSVHGGERPERVVAHEEHAQVWQVGVKGSDGVAVQLQPLQRRCVVKHAVNRAEPVVREQHVCEVRGVGEQVGREPAQPIGRKPHVLQAMAGCKQGCVHLLQLIEAEERDLKGNEVAQQAPGQGLYLVAVQVQGHER